MKKKSHKKRNTLYCVSVYVRAWMIKTIIIGKQNLVPKLGHGRFRRTTANNKFKNETS